MAARAYWKGRIRLAPVSIPVEIYNAKRAAARKPAAKTATQRKPA